MEAKKMINLNTFIKFYKQHKLRLNSGFVLFIRLALGCLFIYGSLPKIRQPYDFLSNVYGYELVGPKLGMLVAMILPWLELFTGICLIGGIFISGALLASIAMAAMFTFVISFALYWGLEISCGCFGASATGMINYSTLIRAVTILLISILAFFVLCFRSFNNPKTSAITG